VLAHIPEREIAVVHAMDDKRTRDSEDVCRMVRAAFLIFSKDSNPFTLEQMPTNGFNKSRGCGEQVDDLIFAGLPPDPNLDSIALADLSKTLRRLLRSWSDSSTKRSTCVVIAIFSTSTWDKMPGISKFT
jgi:hypothetical protein